MKVKLKNCYNKVRDTLARPYCTWAEQRFLKSLPDLEAVTYVEETEEFGRAVFAAKKILAGTMLGIYPGHKRRRIDFLDKEEFISRSMRYSYYLDEEHVLDPTDLFGHLANKSNLRLALINEPPLGATVNVYSIPSAKHIWYLALNDIETGEQLFTTYGPNFSRNYPTEMSLTNGEVPLTKENISTLKNAAKSYRWLLVTFDTNS